MKVASALEQDCQKYTKFFFGGGLLKQFFKLIMYGVQPSGRALDWQAPGSEFDPSTAKNQVKQLHLC